VIEDGGRGIALFVLPHIQGDKKIAESALLPPLPIIARFL
jgi:hypothetical protein